MLMISIENSHRLVIKGKEITPIVGIKPNVLVIIKIAPIPYVLDISLFIALAIIKLQNICTFPNINPVVTNTLRLDLHHIEVIITVLPAYQRHAERTVLV